MKTTNTIDRDLKQITIWGSALPTGVMLAALQALQRDFSFRFSVGSLIAFIIGTALVLGFWQIIFNTTKPIWRALASAILITIGLGAFLYPLRFVVPSRLAELFTGLCAAVCALSIMAILMLKVRDFLNEDARTQALTPIAIKG